MQFIVLIRNSVSSISQFFRSVERVKSRIKKTNELVQGVPEIASVEFNHSSPTLNFTFEPYNDSSYTHAYAD